MRKLLILGATFVVSMAIVMTACKKDEVNNNGNNSNNTENPGGSSGGGSGSGNQENPSTTVLIPNAVSDIDGNSYDAVQIGNQVWMAENLRTSRYADGSSIPLSSEEHSYSVPYRYNPNNDQSNVSTYGYLYNWTAVMGSSSSSSANPSGVQGICPTGWHVPSDAEWTQLTDYVRSQSPYVCGSNSVHIAKALASTTGWYGSSETCAVGNTPSANNTTGFSAFPAGCYSGYNTFGYNAFFWSATEHSDYSAYNRYLGWCGDRVHRDNNNESYGYSVRCVRD